MKDPALPPSEGDGNMTPARAAWRVSLSERARAALDEDERYFLRQSLSTPCLTEIVRTEGAVLTDIDGRRILDFHGNSVHQLGHGHPRVIAAIAREMETLPFSPRRYANATATTLARRLVAHRARARADPLGRAALSRGVGRQKRWPPAAQSRSASLPIGHQPQPRLRRPFWENDANGGSVPAKSSPRCSSSRT